MMNNLKLTVGNAFGCKIDPIKDTLLLNSLHSSHSLMKKGIN